MKRLCITLLALTVVITTISLVPDKAFAENEDLEGVWYADHDTGRIAVYSVNVAGNAISIIKMFDRLFAADFVRYMVHSKWLMEVDGRSLSGHYYIAARCPKLRVRATGTISADRSRIELTLRRRDHSTVNEWKCTGNFESESRVTLVRR